MTLAAALWAPSGVGAQGAQPVALIRAMNAANWRFYTLDAISGAKRLVATFPRDDGLSARFGVGIRRRFWYVTADGAKHKVVVSDPGTPAR